MKYSLVVDTVPGDLPSVRLGCDRVRESAQAASVPVTWVVDDRSAAALAPWFSERHESGEQTLPDAFVLWLDTVRWFAGDDQDGGLHAAAERLVRQRAELPERLTTLRERMRELLPWADITIVGADMKSSALIGVLEESGVSGLWGYRWNEASPRAQDRGCPYGFFYANADRHNSAGAPMSHVVGIPRESGDLSHWRRVPPEPAGGPVPATPRNFETAERPEAPLDLDPIRLAIDRAHSGGDLNDWSAVVHTIAAEEAAAWNPEASTELAAFWDDVSHRGLDPVSLTDAIAAYVQQFPETDPTAHVCAPHVEAPDAHVEGSRELFYYDGRAQYIFDEGRSEPSECYNYVSPSGSSQYLTEYEPPKVESVVPTRIREALLLEVTVEAPKAMPYALFLWSDHRHLRLQETDVLEVRWLGEVGMLVLLDLEPGTNEFTIDLTI